MKIFEKNNILLFLLLAESIFLVAPINKANAAEFGCQGKTGCKNITTQAYRGLTAYEAAVFMCDSSCDSLDIGGGCRALGVLCPTLPVFTYHCIVINDPEKKLEPGNCKEFSITGKNSTLAGIEGISIARNQCAITAAEANDVKMAPGPCSSPIPNTGPIPGKLAEDLKVDAASLNKLGTVEPSQFIGRFIQILLAFIGSISLVLYIVSGFLWMTASGNTEKVTKAKSIMVWTTLGVVVMLASYMLVSFVFKSLGV